MMLLQNFQTNFRLLNQKTPPFAKQLLTPNSLAKLATKLPLKFNTFLIETVANKVLSTQIKEGDFDFLEYKTLQIEMIDAEIKLGLSYNNNKIQCIHFGQNNFQADVTLSVNTSNAISLIKQEIDPDTLFFQRKLKIQGDTELAHHIKNTIDTLDPKVIPNFIMNLITEYKKRVL